MNVNHIHELMHEEIELLTISNSGRHYAAIEQDEYQWLVDSLERWADRRFKHIDPWRSERSQITGLWA
jgi:hypothetical protein